MSRMEDGEYFCSLLTFGFVLILSRQSGRQNFAGVQN